MNPMNQTDPRFSVVIKMDKGFRTCQLGYFETGIKPQRIVGMLGNFQMVRTETGGVATIRQFGQFASRYSGLTFTEQNPAPIFANR